MLLFEVLDAVGKLSPEEMPAPHRLLLVVLARRHGGTGRIYPKLETIAAETGLGLSTVKRMLNQLEASGWLTRQRRYDASGRITSNRYDLCTRGAPIEPARSEPARSGPPPGPERAPTRPAAGHKQIREEINETTHSACAREEQPSSSEVRPVIRSASHAPRKDDETPATVRSQVCPALPEPGAEVAAVLAQLRRHEVIVLAARATPAGEQRALFALAEQIAGNAIASGKHLAWVLAAVGQAASELAAESAGMPLHWSAVVRRVRTFADRARASHADPSLLDAEPHARHDAGRCAPWSDDERALVDAYRAVRKRRGWGEVIPLDLHFTAARRVLPDLRRLEANAAAGRPDILAPTWLEIARHRLEAFFRGADAKLEAAGFPLDWLLRRTDAAGLPAPRRPGRLHARDAPAIKLPDRELARLARRPIEVTEASELEEALAEFHALRAGMGAVSCGRRRHTVG